MLTPQTLSLPGHIQAVYVHNSLKLIAFILSKEEFDEESIKKVNFNNKVSFVNICFFK